MDKKNREIDRNSFRKRDRRAGEYLIFFRETEFNLFANQKLISVSGTEKKFRQTDIRQSVGHNLSIEALKIIRRSKHDYNDKHHLLLNFFFTHKTSVFGST